MKYSRPLLLTLFSFAALFLAGCRGLTADPQPSQPPPPPQETGSLESVKHIIVTMQENRSFDHYFGKLGAYRQAHGYGQASDIDGIPADASNPDPQGVPVNNFHLQTMCMENLTPDWLESHGDYNLGNLNFPENDYKGNGYVSNAAGLAGCCVPQPAFDLRGVRAIGWYDETDLPYYYFMASNFAMSDRFFSPLPGNSVPNRVFGLAATTYGYLHTEMPAINRPTIFSLLEDANITWKYYYIELAANGKPNTTLNNFFPIFADAHADKIVPVSEFFTDLQNDTLPQVVFIQEAHGLDEHPGGTIAGVNSSGNHVQRGAAYIKSYVDALMASKAWASSVFFLTWDEAGGFYDHVSPVRTVSPDGILPKDAQPKDQQAINPPLGYTGNGFDVTGFRVPNLIISPFARKSFVSHTPMDFTAYLTFIQKRFNLPHLTARDAAQPDMTEFFDFKNPPWLTPPTPPAQPTGGLCDITALPE